MRYEIWMGFKNYKGQVYDVTKIAEFYSKARAEHYLELCKAEADDSEVYSLGEYEKQKGARQ